MIRVMQSGDIDGAMRLKTNANWNQTRLDWDRLLRLEPNGCFVEERDGQVVGSTTALRYGTELAWIGMVLVLPEFRRQGIAKKLMQHALAWLEERGNAAVGLDATAMGYPLYRQLGFFDEGPIERWQRPPISAGNQRQPRSKMVLPDALATLDHAACGYDRSALLHDLLAGVSVECTQGAGGFAFGRPGSSAWYVGPCVARSESDAETLLVELLAQHSGERVFWDLLPSGKAARRLARELGFRPARSLRRMFRGRSGGGARHPQASWLYATAGFEFG